MAVKKFFRKILQIGNQESKTLVTSEIKDYYDSRDFDDKDVYNISKWISKEDELFEYANIPDYYKTN